MDGLIYNQRKIPKSQWRYGLRSSAAVGCGWIATYNALYLLGRRAEPEKLIRYFERQLPLIHGNTGTNALGPAICLKQMGYTVKVSARRREFDEMARQARVCILFYHWRKGGKLGAHFVALEYQDGSYIGYNTYNNSTGPDDYGPDLDDFLRKKGYFGCVLTAVE